MKKLILLLVAGLLASSAFAVNTRNVSFGGTNGYPDFYGRKVYTIQRTFNLGANIPDASSSGGVHAPWAFADGDIAQIIPIPAESIVLAVTTAIPTVFTNSTAAIEVGDTSDANRYLALTAATNKTLEALYATPVLKTNAEYITITFSNAPGYTGIVDVKALILDINSYQGD